MYMYIENTSFTTVDKLGLKTGKTPPIPTFPDFLSLAPRPRLATLFPSGVKSSCSCKSQELG